jgi:hypothetical protein
LAKDLTTANKPTKKALKKKLVSTTTKAKKATLTVLIRRKVSTQSRAGTSKLIKSVVVAEIEVVVVPAVTGGKRVLIQLNCHNALDKKI